MSSLTETRIFNQPDTVVESWYWAFKSSDLKKGQIKPLNFLGQELAVYRGEDGVVRAVEAYCPHMGAHLAEGKVDGKGVRCFFHAWKFDESGELVDIPCRKSPGIQEKIKHFPVCEQYGVIWIYTGETPSHPVHFVPELEGVEVAHAFGNQFVKECHPNVVMINAIDAHHFTSVHHLPVNVQFETIPLSPHTIQFNNTTHMPQSKWYLRFFSKFYAGPLTYSMAYTAGSTGSVTVGPDFLHCHIIFALRPNAQGHAEGLTILLTPTGAHKNKLAWLNVFNPIILFATKLVGNYFAGGDTEVFKTIKFKFNRPIKEDSSIIKFMQHLEKQKTARWGFGSKMTGETPLPLHQEALDAPAESLLDNIIDINTREENKRSQKVAP
ncbi:MAG: aromatic ring-hydroxylating dioxygenase subunit alpha [Candidatus Sericytochromatia bacterium]|nr:aromatic ring-hydroxylating dioxygenase subunit alpha [Candidatus Sericytochromatia bacterium]